MCMLTPERPFFSRWSKIYWWNAIILCRPLLLQDSHYIFCVCVWQILSGFITTLVLSLVSAFQNVFLCVIVYWFIRFETSTFIYFEETHHDNFIERNKHLMKPYDAPSLKQPYISLIRQTVHHTRHKCLSSNFAQRIPQDVKLLFHPCRNSCLAET